MEQFRSLYLYLATEVYPTLRLFSSLRLSELRAVQQDAILILRMLKGLCGRSLDYSEEAHSFVRLLSHRELLHDIRECFAVLTGNLEKLAAPQMADLLSRGTQDFEFSSMMKGLWGEGGKKLSDVLDFEKLPEIPAEIAAAGIGPSSKVVAIGTGALSLTGVSYAASGAEVVLVDVDRVALQDF